MFNKLLIPLDGSPLAENAFAPAFALARESGAEVLLFRVAYPEEMVVPEHGVTGAHGFVWPEQAVGYSRREADEYLRAVQAAYASPEHLVWARISFNESPSADVAALIVETAHETQRDLIVMSSHGRSGIERWMLGSVAERVLTVAPCPVLITRSAQPIRHVLIPLDGSELAERALAPGFTAAARLGCAVTLLQATPAVQRQTHPQGRVTYHFFGSGVAGAIKQPLKYHVGQSLQDNLRDEALTYLERVRNHYGHLGLTVQTAAIVGSPAEVILHFAETNAVDCIVMATHGRTGLSRWVYGSVMHKVLRGSHTSLLVVRPACDG